MFFLPSFVSPLFQQFVSLASIHVWFTRNMIHADSRTSGGEGSTQGNQEGNKGPSSRSSGAITAEEKKEVQQDNVSSSRFYPVFDIALLSWFRVWFRVMMTLRPVHL
jgi:hypothetical protein